MTPVVVKVLYRMEFHDLITGPETIDPAQHGYIGRTPARAADPAFYPVLYYHLADTLTLLSLDMSLTTEECHLAHRGRSGSILGVRPEPMLRPRYDSCAWTFIFNRKLDYSGPLVIAKDWRDKTVSYGTVREFAVVSGYATPRL